MVRRARPIRDDEPEEWVCEHLFVDVGINWFHFFLPVILPKTFLLLPLFRMLPKLLPMQRSLVSCSVCVWVWVGVSMACDLTGATSKLLELTSPELPAAPSGSQVQAEPALSQVRS